DEIDGVVTELARPVFGPIRDRNALLLLEDNGDFLGVHDYIRGRDATLPPRHIPRSMWDAAQDYAFDDVVFNVATAAATAGEASITRNLMNPVAKAGSAYAINTLRVLNFRRVLQGATLALACLAIIVGIVSALWPNVFNPCPPALPSAPTCPSGRSHITGVD